MSDTNTTPTTQAAATPKPRTSIIRTLTNGAAGRLQINAIRNKNDWSCYVVSQEVGKDKKLKTLARGASERVADEAEAQAYVTKAVAAATKLGWQVPEGPKGFEAKPDSFSLTSLPKPTKK